MRRRANRPRPEPVTVRYPDGTTELVSAKAFQASAAQKEQASEARRELREQRRDARYQRMKKRAVFRHQAGDGTLDEISSRLGLKRSQITRALQEEQT